MMNSKNLKEKSRTLYKNVEYIIMYFEDQFAPGLKWIRDGNLMRLVGNEKMFVCYDEAKFKKIQ